MRHEEWIAQLWAAIDAARDRPFTYGNCVQLAAECCDAVSDGSSKFVEHVAPLIAAQKEPIALDELQRLVTAALGEPVPRNLLQQGDVALLELPSGAAVGIVTGHLIACASITKGVAYLKLEKALLGWRVT